LRTSLHMFFYYTPSTTTEIYTLSLHDALPICTKSFNQLVIRNTYQELSEEEKNVFDKESINLQRHLKVLKEYYRYESIIKDLIKDRKSTRLNSSHVSISYAVFCLKKKKIQSTQ